MAAGGGGNSFEGAGGGDGHDARLVEDPLFLACTRPAMVMGVPLEAMAVNGMATSLVFVVTKNPLYGAVGLVLHLAFRALAGWDHNCFRVLALWAETKGRSRNAAHWGGSTVSPLPVRRPRRASDVRVLLRG